MCFDSTRDAGKQRLAGNFYLIFLHNPDSKTCWTSYASRYFHQLINRHVCVHWGSASKELLVSVFFLAAT